MTETLIKNLDQQSETEPDESSVCSVFFASIKELYSKYIMYDAALEVNISYRLRLKITGIFAEDQAALTSGNKFDVTLIASALTLIESAVAECVSLMTQSAIRYSVDQSVHSAPVATHTQPSSPELSCESPDSATSPDFPDPPVLPL